MPQLLSRLDAAGWLTPAIAEVLDELPPLPHDERFRREQVATILKRLNDVGAPVRVVRVGVFPSLTLYVVQPSTPRRRGSSQPTSVEEIARQLPRLKDALQAESVGIVPNWRDSPEYIGILVRMADHHTVRLRNLVLMPAFQSAEPNTALVLGMALDQQPVVRDLLALPHLLLVGEGQKIGQLLRRLLLNLVLFSTPAEVRIALMNLGSGEAGHLPETLSGLPHVLGHRLRTTAESLKLLDGLLKESGRRLELFQQHAVTDLAAYHARIDAQPDKVLPRVIVVMEDLLSAEWLALREQWFSLLEELLATGPQVGIHLLMTAHLADESALPEFLARRVRSRVVLSTSSNLARLWGHNVPPPSTFIDGFLIEGDSHVTPLTVGTVSDDELSRVVSYWQRAEVQRASGQSGTALDEEEDAGPISPDAAAAAAEKARSVEAGPSVSPPLPTPDALYRAAEALTPDDVKLARARALAAYLGWLAHGPLRDVLLMSYEDADVVIARLQAEGILEAGDGPVYRFLRLDET